MTGTTARASGGGGGAVSPARGSRARSGRSAAPRAPPPPVCRDALALDIGQAVPDALAVPLDRHIRARRLAALRATAPRRALNARAGERAALIADDVYTIIMDNKERLDSEIIYDRDFDYDYFGFKTLERSYLLRVNGVMVERPQHMLMRVAVGIHKNDVDAACETYKLMSERWFTHASPTLFNAGTPKPQLSSCFLIAMKSDSIEGIYDTLKECATISKSAGGIGLHIHNIRATGSALLRVRPCHRCAPLRNSASPCSGLYVRC